MKVCKHIRKFLYAIQDVTLNNRGWFENVTCKICGLRVDYHTDGNYKLIINNPIICFDRFKKSDNPNEYDIDNIQDLINDRDWGRDIKLKDIRGKRIPKIELVEI